MYPTPLSEVEIIDPPAEEPADHSPADERWLAEHPFDDPADGGQLADQDDDDDDLTAPIDIDVLPPSALYSEADGPLGQMFGHDA